MASNYRRWILLWLACMAFVLTACGRGDDEPTAEVAAPTTSVETPTALAAPAAVATTATVPTVPALATAVEPTLATPVTAPVGPEGIGIDQFIQASTTGQPFQGAILVAREGEVLLRQGYGLANSATGVANGPDTMFRIGSITKPFTAIAVLMLQEQGRLSVQDSVCNYLAECPEGWQVITLHHLLSHTSGIADLTRLPEFATFVTQPSTPLATLAFFAGQPLDFAPGERWEYSNSNYIVLGAVIETVAGQSYEEFVQSQIFAPLQMDNSGYDHNLDTLAVGYQSDGTEAAFIEMSVPFAAGALYSSVEDLYLWDQALRSDQLLPQAAREAMFTVQAPAAMGGPEEGYGYGWVIGSSEQGKYVEHTGTINGFSGKLRRYLETDALIIVLGNVEGVNPNPLVEGIADVMFD